jgi:hypothetical protein
VESAERGLGIHFQALVLQQIFGQPLSPAEYGEHVVSILLDGPAPQGR